jgi:uncharacterized protein
VDNIDMKFPQDLLRFLYWIFFKPFSLYRWIHQIDPTLETAAHVLTLSYDRSTRPLRNLALFYILVMPWLLAAGTGLVISGWGADVNWLRLAFTLLIGMAVSLTFSIQFCIAFLLPFSLVVAIWSSTSFTIALAILFSLMLGLAYGLNAGNARWGLTAGLVYGVLLSILLGPLSGLAIGAAFLTGYFRILFYLLEAPLSWTLGELATKGDALKLWQFQPVLWDELIWFPLPGLDKHLLAIKRQEEHIFHTAILYVQESFRQSWAAERIVEKE